MSIEHKNKSASPVSGANAEAISHHPIADLFPALPENELAELAEDIATNGQREPGVVWDGKLVEGKNRQLACKLKGIPFKVVTRDFADEHEAVAFSISANLRRRHLNESQRAMIGAKLVEFMSAVKPQSSSVSVTNEGISNADTQKSQKTRDKAAETLNVSARSVQNAIKVRADGTPELVNAVNAGRASVSAAAQVASLGKDEQVKVIKTPGGVKAAAKKLRNDKKSATRTPDQKLPANTLPPNLGASYPDAHKNAKLPDENNLPATNEQSKASAAEQTLVKNRLRFVPNDAEIDRASRIFSDANAAHPDCEALATRLLGATHPGEAAQMWTSIEEFASRMRNVYESLNDSLNETMSKENPAND